MEKCLLIILTITFLIIEGCSSIKHTNSKINTIRIQEEKDLNKKAIKWKKFFLDYNLKKLIQIALKNNHDLKQASLNLLSYKTLYQIKNMELLPTINSDIDINLNKSKKTTKQYKTGFQVSWEVDLFDNIKNLRASELEKYLSNKEVLYTTQASLIANVANAYLKLKFDQKLYEIYKTVLQNNYNRFLIIKSKFFIGVSTALDVYKAKIKFNNALLHVIKSKNNIVNDINSLSLLIGLSLPNEFISNSVSIHQKFLDKIPNNLSSLVLTHRPDIKKAEHDLKSVHANMMSVRAEFFPKISLTTNSGFISSDLSSLLSSKNFLYGISPKIHIPMFDLKKQEAKFANAKIQKNNNVINYKKTINIALKDVANSLIERQTLLQELQVQCNLLNINNEYYNFVYNRYTLGIDNYLSILEAKELLLSEKLKLIQLVLKKLSNEINLYKSIGGWWH